MIFGENLRMFGGILWMMITGDLPSKIYNATDRLDIIYLYIYIMLKFC